MHGLLLGGDYSRHPGHAAAGRAQKIIGWLILAQALFGIAFAWVYVQGKEDKPWLAQGIALRHRRRVLDRDPDLSDLSRGHAGADWCLHSSRSVFDTIRVVLMGVVLAWINR